MQGRTQPRCRVCGSHEIARDEVLDGGALGLAECERCGHLWTERPVLRALQVADLSDAQSEVAIAA